MPKLPLIAGWQTQSVGVDAFSMENEELTMKNKKLKMNYPQNFPSLRGGRRSL
ncbi:MAG: hypothetical protein J0M05_12110 [Candidatus Kapabacteria bacterium]|nr:hypothetical protein [Candidatus Kapabacteria bacterium]